MAGTKLTKSLLAFLKLSGGTMTGSITIPTGEDITLTDAPGSGTDAANKTYVDATAAPTSNAYSTTLIKVMPTDFMVNDDYSGRAANVIEDDTSNTLAFKTLNVNNEAYAFVHIPNGYKATHCIVRASASTSNAATCFTYNLQTGLVATLASGDFDFNSIEDITDVVASATNDLVIKISPASTSTLIFGAEVTIAAV